MSPLMFSVYVFILWLFGAISGYGFCWGQQLRRKNHDVTLGPLAAIDTPLADPLIPADIPRLGLRAPVDAPLLGQLASDDILVPAQHSPASIQPPVTEQHLT